MNAENRHELERELVFEVPAPPADLGARLRAEIPPDADARLAQATARELSAAPSGEGVAAAAGQGPANPGEPPTPRGAASGATAPDAIRVQSAPGPTALPRRGWGRPQLLLAAASLAVLTIATAVVLQLAVPPPGERALTFADEGHDREASEATNEVGEAAGGVEQEAPASPATPAPAAPPRQVAGSSTSTSTFADGDELLAADALAVTAERWGDREASAPARPTPPRVAAAAPESFEAGPGGAPLRDDRRLRLESQEVDGAPASVSAPSAAEPEAVAPVELAELADPGLAAPSPRPAAPAETRDAAGALGGEGRRATPRAAKEAQLQTQMEAKVSAQASAQVYDRHEELREPSVRPVHPVPSPPPPPVPSTGGTTEPNDQPFGDMFFRSSDTNPFVDTEEDRWSTFGLDVDTGSYTLARSYLERGHLPPREAIRVEEWVNAFAGLYGDRPPRRGDFALSAEGAPSPFAGGDDYRLLRFGIRARDLAPAARPPVVLTFVIDVSGSMDQENRLGLVQRALGLLVDELGTGDRVGVVVYGSDARVVLPHTGDLVRVRRAVEALRPEGATNAEAGLTLGYDLAAAAFREGASNRVVLCSDGVANVGATGPESILARIGEEARRGIELTTVGFGMGNYNDALMERLADQGDGRYAYVDDLGEARRLFVDELTGTLHSIAGDAKVQVTFDPRVVERWRLLGYENRDVADERFRDDSVDAGEIGFGHAVTALYEVKLRDDAPRGGTVARLALRYRQLASGEVIEVHQDLPLGELARRFSAASPGLRLAAAVAELAELLRGSFWARGSHPDQVVRELVALEDEAVAREPAVRELRGLAEDVSRLAGSGTR
jgi:Ca-activated chloride channel family protein